MKKKCIFCNDQFPKQYQEISSSPKHWRIVHNIRPLCDYHCLIVSKEHTQHIGTEDLSADAYTELGYLLHRTGIAIKKCAPDIKNVHIASLNSGENTKHLHFHIIPVFEEEQVKQVDNVNIDGGGFTFLSRKEIVDDTLDKYLAATCGKNAEEIVNSINKALVVKVTDNTILLKKFLDLNNEK